MACLPKRYEIAVMIFCGITLMYTLRVSLSLAIIAMVGTYPSNLTAKEEDVCPSPVYEETSDSIASEGDVNWSQEMVSQVLAAFNYGFILTQLLGGYAADRLGTKYVFGTSLAVCAFLYLISPLAITTHFYFFFVVRFVQGIFAGVTMPALHLLISKWFPPRERSMLTSALFSAIFVGSLVAMGLSGLLISWYGWSSVFYFFGSITLAWCFLWALLAFDSPRVHPRITQEEQDYIHRGLGFTEPQPSAPRSIPWISILTSLPVWAAMLANFGVTWVLNFFIILIPQYSKFVLRFSIQTNGFYSAVPYLANFMGCILSGAVSQWLRHRQYISHLTAYRMFNGVALIGPAVCLVIIAQLKCNVTGIVVLLGVAMGMRGAFFGGSYLNHMDLAIRYTGIIAGIIHTFINLTGILVPLIAGWIVADKVQSQMRWNILFYLAAGLLVVVYVVYLFFGSVEEQPWNRPREEVVSDNPDQQVHLVNSSSLAHTDLETTRADQAS